MHSSLCRRVFPSKPSCIEILATELHDLGSKPLTTGANGARGWLWGFCKRSLWVTRSLGVLGPLESSLLWEVVFELDFIMICLKSSSGCL